MEYKFMKNIDKEFIKYINKTLKEQLKFENDCAKNCKEEKYCEDVYKTFQKKAEVYEFIIFLMNSFELNEEK